MIHIKRFIDKVSHMESKNTKDLVMPMNEAKGLRDELANLLADLYSNKKESKDDFIKIEMKGGSFR